MILTDEKKKEVREKISSTVKFRETYNEVYDHLLSCLEHTDGEYDGDSADAVVRQEFGGYEGLKDMERLQTKVVYKAMRAKHWQNVKEFFNPPVIIFTLGITVGAFFIVSDPVRCKYLMLFTCASAIMPTLYIVFIKFYHNGWQMRSWRKPSVKESYIFNAAVLSTSLFNVSTFVYRDLLHNGSVLMFVFVFFTIYVISFFKLYRESFRMGLAT